MASAPRTTIARCARTAPHGAGPVTLSAVTSSLLSVEGFVAVDAPPASGWNAERPEGLAAQLWAHARPDDVTLGGLGLPDGTVIRGADGSVLGWESAPELEADLSKLWLRCAQSFPSTGLWPICDTGPLRPFRAWDLGRTDTGEPFWLAPYALPTDVYDAVNTADREDYFRDGGDDPDFFLTLLQDFGLAQTGMQLAEAERMPTDPLSGLLPPPPPQRLTLVACRRPADAALLLDFGIPNDAVTPGIITGVLRSWETRFGVVPVTLDLAWTAFQVLAPPTEATQIDRLATEVFSFASDTGIQSGFHPGHLDRQCDARSMVQSREWLIWWD